MKNYLSLIPYFLLIIVFTLTLLSCSNNSTSTDMEQPEDEPQTEAGITLENSGANSYLVTNITGDGADSELDSPNATITLEVGGRYTFVNDAGASSHPLDFRNSDRVKLLGQSNSSGSFDDNSEVNVIRNGDMISFTLTEGLSEELFDYICSFHPPMNGRISIE
ncbi:hypothetical protein BH23BAC3_BH23BAC3_12810 [soil metagenome]